MAQKVQDIVSDEIIDESTVKKQAEEAKKELEKETSKEKAEKKESTTAKTEQKKKKNKKSLRGKKYQVAQALVDRDKLYSIEEAIEKVIETTVVSFDSTVEVHVKLSLAGIRGTIFLPAGRPKVKKIAIADEKTIEDILSKIKAGKIDFDILLAVPAVMPKLASAAKILGPQGKMPSPKSGTVVEDVKAAAEEIKSGKVEYKQDDQKNIHLAIAKVSWGKEKIKDNLKAFLKILPKDKVTGIYLTSSMGPSVKVEIPK